MFCFLCISLLHSRNGHTLTSQNPYMGVSLSSFFRYLSTYANQYSFPVSYLIHTFGFSPKSALKVSKRVVFETPEKPNLTLSFFEKLGFSKTQISEIIRKRPRVLLSNPEKTIFPKVDFFWSKGASTPDLVRIFTSCPQILHSSLEDQLVPSFNFTRELVNSDDEALAAVKKYPSILCNAARVVPNINTLREIGVPVVNILYLIKSTPQAIATNFIKFGEAVEKVREMGFDPSKSKFVAAIVALAAQSKSNRDKKVDAYKRWGWSDNDISRAFEKDPRCMAISEDKITAVMDFYINKMGLDSSVIAYCPYLLSLSLKKRLIPRGAVFQFLSSKGLLKSSSSITCFFLWTEKLFLERFVNRQEEAPHLLKLYNEKSYLLKGQGNLEKRKENM